MSKTVHLCILILISFSSCSEKPSKVTKEKIKKNKEQIVSEAKETLENYFNAIRNDGLMAEFDYLDKSKDFFWVPPGYSAPISYDSVAAILNQNAGKYLSVNNSFDTLIIIPLKKKLVTYSGKIHSVIIDTSENRMEFDLVETGVMIKRKDGWKLLHGQTSVIK